MNYQGMGRSDGETLEKLSLLSLSSAERIGDDERTRTVTVGGATQCPLGLNVHQLYFG